jgi:integrase/recombinase XerD
MAQAAEFDLEQALKEFGRHIQFGVSDKSRVTESTAIGYKGDVLAFEDFLELNRTQTDGLLDVTTSDLRQYLKHCREKGDKPSTIVKKRAALSRFFATLLVLAEDDVIPLDPDAVPENPEDDFDQIWSVGKPHKSKKQAGKSYISPEQFPKLYQKVPSPKKRNLLIIKLLYQTGMRRKELATLRLDDVLPLDNQEVTIRAENAKSGKQRTVYYKEEMINRLREWIGGGYRDSERMAGESEYLLPTRDSVHITPGHVTEIVKQAAKNAGLQSYVYTDSSGGRRKKVTPHTLRHSYAINMLRPPNQIDVRTLQSHLGHSDLSVTEEYLDYIRDDEKKEYQRVGGPPESAPAERT